MLVSACSSHVQTPGHLSKLEGAQVNSTSRASGHDPGTLMVAPGEKFNADEDEIVSDETRKAWLHALAHDGEAKGMDAAAYAKLRHNDEAESMTMLKALEKRYPKASFIKTMMGQVEQHFGKKEEAAAYYEEGMMQNRRDPVLLFKIAEMRRESGKLERARSFYEQVIEIQPDFPGARVGIARCLLADKKSAAEGRKMLEDILAKNADDKDAKAALAQTQKNR